MDGVKPVSVGHGAIVRHPARMGCIDRIRIQPQPAIFVHNGSRLGRGGMRPAVVYVDQKEVGAPGDPYIHFNLADRILDRESLPSAAPRKCTVCRGGFDHDYWHYLDYHTSQKHKRLFYQKRGV